VDISRFHQTDKGHFKKMLAPADERILVHVSNFRKVKRVEDVIKVFAQVLQKTPSKLLMIGDGPERQNAEELCRHLGIYHEVRFLGKQEQMDEILSIADLFLLPSAYESFGLAALEAMACGVPVISTNVGGLPEINVQGVTGFLSNVGDVDDMAKHALELLNDDTRLQDAKIAAKEHARTFEKSRIIPIYEALYEQVLNGYVRESPRADASASLSTGALG
jgi:N-acetyl-alpha-D-glucosaminyl L-malate synthase BshA